MTEEQMQELKNHITNKSDSNCGFGTIVMIMIILFSVMDIPSKNDIKQIVQQEISK